MTANRHRQLRERVLGALGLSSLIACGPSAAATSGQAPVVDVKPVASSAEIVEPDEPDDRRQSARCSGDAYRDWMCGVTAEEPSSSKDNVFATCPANNAGVRRRLAPPQSLEPLASMQLDARLTQTYRKHQAGVAPARPTERLCCYSACRTVTVVAAGDAIVDGWIERARCVGRFDAPSIPAEREPACAAAVVFDEGPEGHFAALYHENLTRYYSNRETAVGPTEMCCYRSVRPKPAKNLPVIIPGRPLRSEGRAVVAPLVTAGEWAASVSASGSATNWRRAAQLEHASVGAFAQLARHLVAMGAPASLIADAHRAARDEIVHARLAFGVVRAAGGSAEPGALVAPLPAVDAEQLVRECLWDGCLNETAAALDAEQALEREPQLASVHRRIAEDEQRHALLAWQVVAWALHVDPSLVTTVRETLDAIAERLGDDACPVQREAFEHVVLPCGRALVGAHTGASIS
jgi:hypothetical protein